MRQFWQLLVRFHLLLLFLVLQLMAVLWSRSELNVGQSNISNALNEASGRVFAMSNNVTDYFKLQRINKELADENARLKAKKPVSKGSVDQMTADSTWAHLFEIKPAKVVSLSVSNLRNYITIDKGRKDGISEGCGIISSTGLVGKVVRTSANYSIGMPVINNRWRVNVQHATSAYNGYLIWSTGNISTARVQSIPRHVKVAVGDTLITNSYSKSFPEGLPVATVSSIDHNFTGTFYDLEVKLTTDFRRLNYVYLTQRNDIEEIVKLETEDE